MPEAARHAPLLPARNTGRIYECKSGFRPPVVTRPYGVSRHSPHSFKTGVEIRQRANRLNRRATLARLVQYQGV